MDWIRFWGIRCSVLALILSVVLPGLAADQVAYSQGEVQATVMPVELNVRERPSFDAPILGVYTRGDVLRVTGWDGTVWVFATPLSGDLTGWVHWDYVNFPDGFDVSMLPIITATGAAGTASESVPNESAAPAAPAPAAGQLSGSTVDIVNFRAGPGTTYPVLQTLPAATPLILAGRSADAAWLKVQAADQSGWLFAQFVAASGDIWSLPEVAANPAANPNGSAAPPVTNASVLIHESVIPVVSAHAREIFLQGQEMGNRPDVFVTVGDSITAAPMFLDPIGIGFYELGDYASLQATIDYFSRTPARTGNSFVNESIAAHGAWTTHNLVTPGLHFRSDICNDDETALMCEYRLTRPSIALIMIGTNDVSAGMETIHFRHSMEMIVQITLHFGIIPVLSTIPDNLTNNRDTNKAHEFNNVIRDVAAAYDVPLLDYWRAMRALPNYGLDRDGIHPSYDTSDRYSTANFTGEYLYYGYNMRNLTALLTLEAVWRGAMY
jgi:uncharacterized protein YraI